MRALCIPAILLLTCLSAYAEEPVIVAHRGASRDAPENTLPAFRLAWEQGADAIEGDFRLTRDGHIVCMHDESTKRVAGEDLAIEKSTLAALRKLDVGAHHGPQFEGTPIPTIAEVFATVPDRGKRVYVEIKCGVEIIPPLLAEIAQAGLEPQQVVIISFHEEVIQAIKARAPRYKAFWLCGFKEEKESGKVVPSPQSVLETLERIEADGLSSGKDLIDESLIQRVRDKGYEYHVWTVDDPDTARRFQKWGARSITTNVPGLMRKHLVGAGS
ncbi:MAG: glycerophosphodiester phosphodiesterase [Pirellulales bacterium]|nr:glycerophosphodiester phosphodiesterase [Pirellulales bacterium]